MYLFEGYGYKHQPIIFSDNDLYINYDKWKSGELNTCLVTALSGAGKSTISKKIAENFDAYYIEIDVVSFKIGILHPERANLEYIKRNDKYLYQFFKENNIPPNIMVQFTDYQDIRKSEIINKYIYWLCFERPDKDTNKVIVEGGDVAIALAEIEELAQFPIIIKGTSIAKSLLRRFLRTCETRGFAHAFFNIFKSWYKQYSKMIPEVNAARQAVMNQEYEELEESFNYRKHLYKIEKNTHF